MDSKPSEGPFSITSTKLNGNFFLLWSRAVRMYVFGKEKFGDLTGANKKHTDPTKIDAWESVNAIVMSCLLNSMEQHIAFAYFFYESAAALWTALQKSYGTTSNEPRIFQLTTELYSLAQNNMSITEYFGALQSRWEELSYLQPLSKLPDSSSAEIARKRDKAKTYKFLAGLNADYESLRTQLIATIPFPSLEIVYSIVHTEEACRQVMTMPITLSSPAQERVTFISSTTSLNGRGGCFDSRGSSSVHGRGRGGSRYFCTYCNRSGHSVERCFKIHGYPSAHATMIDVKEQPMDNVKIPDTSLSESTLMTRAEVMELLRSLQPPTSATPFSDLQPSSTSFVATTGSALHASSASSTWIIDFGASDHMTGLEYEDDYWYGI